MNVTAPPPAAIATTNNNREPLPATVATNHNNSPLIKNGDNNGGNGTNNSTPLIHKPSSSVRLSTPNSTTISSLNNILLKKKPMTFHGKGSFPLNLTLMLESVEREWSFDDDDSEMEDGDNEIDRGGDEKMNGVSVNDDKANSIGGGAGGNGSTTPPKDKKNGDKMNHIISWLPCGTGFAIHNTDAFLKEVLPKFFK